MNEKEAIASNCEPLPPETGYEIDFSDQDWLLMDLYRNADARGVTVWGMVLALLMVKRKTCKWAGEMYDLFNTESTDLTIDTFTKTWWDEKHGDDWYTQPRKKTWEAYKKWMEATLGLKYKSPYED